MPSRSPQTRNEAGKIKLRPTYQGRVVAGAAGSIAGLLASVPLWGPFKGKPPDSQFLPPGVLQPWAYAAAGALTGLLCLRQAVKRENLLWRVVVAWHVGVFLSCSIGLGAPVLMDDPWSLPEWLLAGLTWTACFDLIVLPSWVGLLVVGVTATYVWFLDRLLAARPHLVQR